MIINNAELKRNLWLDFTPERMILAFVIIFLICYLLKISFSLACFFIFLWGVKAASECVIEEVNQNTWDFQRQSAMSPLEMSFGKLIGSTAFAWFCAGISLAFYSYHATQEPSLLSKALTQAFGQKIQALSILDEILLLVMGGLLTQAFAVVLSLQVLSKLRQSKNIKSFRYFLIAVLIGGFLSYQMFISSKLIDIEFKWHQIDFNIASFAFTSLCIFLAWGLIGVYRSFSKELQFSQIPWVWLLFNIFCIIYFSGFVSMGQIETHRISGLDDVNDFIKSAPSYTAFIVAVVLGYSALLVDNLSYVQYQKLVVHFKGNRLLEALTYLPLWMVSFVFIMLTTLYALSHPLPLKEISQEASSSILVLTTLGFVIRDYALMHYLSLVKKTKIVGTFILYLFLLYFLVPFSLRLVGLKGFNAFFLPSFGQDNMIAFLGISIQLAVIISLLATAIKKCQPRTV